MTTELTITWNITHNSCDPENYRLTLAEVDDATYEVRQIGPVVDGVHFSRGVYADRDTAVKAAQFFIGAPCRIVQAVDPISGETRVSVHRMGRTA